MHKTLKLSVILGTPKDRKVHLPEEPKFISQTRIKCIKYVIWPANETAVFLSAKSPQCAEKIKLEKQTCRSQTKNEQKFYSRLQALIEQLRGYYYV